MKRPSRVLYVDASQGASGDMILGALIDLGVPLAHVKRALERLPLDGWTLRSRRIERCSLRLRRVEVRVKTDVAGRGWRAIRRIVTRGGLEPAVRDRALAIFRQLIEAEAQVHGRSPETVHLHEAGGTDAIVDVVGSCVALAKLDVERVVVSPMTTGFGTVRCAHGVYPVPAPATALLVRGAPVSGGPIEAERLTPTGAAILTTVADAWGSLPQMRPVAVGYGAGSRDLGPVPNALRMIVGETDALEPADAAPEVVVLECNLDDVTPQELAFAVERLLELGALDAFTESVTMKKGRVGHRLTVLSRPEGSMELARAILRESSSLGLRYRTERRVELSRRVRRVRTPYGEIDVKVGEMDGRMVRAWPEYDQCAALAARHGATLREVRQAALQNFKNRSRR